jgi:hypothetical protein
MSDLYLTKDEVEHITGKKHAKAQRAVLAAMGYSVNLRPDSTFWVPRAQFLEQQVKPRKYKMNLDALNVA